MGTMRTFLAIWTGQLVSGVGSVMAGFALGVWVFQETGSPTRFALITLASTLPGLVLDPLAGGLVDRWSRRRLMIGGDLIAAFCSVGLLLVIWPVNRLQVWHIYWAVAVASVFSAAQHSAFDASVPLLVPKRHLGRAAGLSQVSAAASRILAPTLAGLLLVSAGLVGVLVLDVAAAILAVGVLFLVRIPQPPSPGRVTGKTLVGDALLGWQYIRQRSGLLHLVLLFAAVNLATGMVQVLLAPLVLSRSDARAYGLVLSVHALGFFAGGSLMSVTGGPRRRIRSILGLLVLLGLCLVLGGLRPSVPLIAGAFFGFMFLMPVIFGSSQVIWQQKVEPELMGRVFAIRRVVALSTTPLAFLVAGPLAEFVLEPALQPGGALAASLGPIFGTGPGRGIGVLFAALGLFILLVTALAASSPRLLRLEEELPDRIPEQLSPLEPGSPEPSAQTSP